MIGTGSTALVAAVPYPGKAAWISRMGQRSTKKKKLLKKQNKKLSVHAAGYSTHLSACSTKQQPFQSPCHCFLITATISSLLQNAHTTARTNHTAATYCPRLRWVELPQLDEQSLRPVSRPSFPAAARSCRVYRGLGTQNSRTYLKTFKGHLSREVHLSFSPNALHNYISPWPHPPATQQNWKIVEDLRVRNSPVKRDTYYRILKQLRTCVSETAPWREVHIIEF